VEDLLKPSTGIEEPNLVYFFFHHSHASSGYNELAIILHNLSNLYGTEDNFAR